jgi:DNA repair protein RadC
MENPDIWLGAKEGKEVAEAGEKYEKAQELKEYKTGETPDGTLFLSESDNDTYSATPEIQWDGDKVAGNVSSIRGIWNKTKNLQFTGTTRVKNASDVAEIMSLLENKTVEHAFAVHVDKKGKSHIQFLGIGGLTGTVVDARMVVAGALKFDSKKVYLVHNHPSGNLVPSNADVTITESILNALSPFGIEVSHVIMDTYKKKYTEIDVYGIVTTDIKRKESKPETKLTTHILDEFEVLRKPIGKVSSSKDAVNFIQQFRFSALPKNAVLILNQRNEVVANYVFQNGVNYNDLMGFVGKEVPQAIGFIFYGNQTDIASVKRIKSRLEPAAYRVLDSVVVNSDTDGVVGYYESAADKGLLSETQEKYNTTPIGGKEVAMPKAPSGPVTAPALTESQKAGEKEMDALQDGDSITTKNPIRLLKGIYGKRNADGTIRSAHTGVDGIFSSITEKIAKRYEGEEGMVVFEVPASVTVEAIQIYRKKIGGDEGVSKLRPMETEAINNSKAQVVKLITFDSRGEEAQYIIKDPALRKIGYKPSEKAALSPEQELKAAFNKWREETGKMGIAPNWEKQAKADIELFRAVANYIRTKLATGAYSFDQFIKDLGKTKIENVDRDKANWEKFYNKTVEESKPLEGKAVKAAVEKAAGIKRSTKSEVQRIIDRAFAIGVGEGTQKGFVKGATEGMKAGAIEGRTQAVDMLRNALANLSGELTPKQISAIVERMGRLKTFSEAAKQNFIDYADKVIDDANYAAKEKKAAEIKNAVKKISNRSNVAANDQSLYKSFASLSISHLSASDLDVYIEWGQKIKNRALKPGDRAALSSFIEKAQERQNAIVQERSEKMKEGRMRNLRAEFDEMEAAGTLPQGISTFQEYVDSKKPKPKGETLEDKITAIDERLNEIPEGENEMIDKLRNVDLSVLNKEDLTLIDNSLYNYIDTGKLYGIGDPLVKAEYLGRVKAAVEAGLKTRRQVDRRDVEKLGMSNLFSTLGETKDAAAKLRGLLIQPWLAAATKANSRYIEIEAALMAKADKLKIKQPNWNRIDLFGFLNEGEGNPELFEKLKEQKLSDLETLKEKVEANEKDRDHSGTAEAQKYAYDSLNQAIQSLGLNENSTLDSIREKLSENEIAFYNETRKYLDQYSPKAIENMELYGNKEVGLTKNYWPRTTNRINEKTAGIDVFDLYGSEYVGKNMFGREKGRSRLLGKAGYYTPVGQENYFNGLKETMLIAEAAHEYHGMQALYNTTDKGFSQLIKGAGANDLKQLMIDWIMDTKNVGRYQGGVAKVGEDILNAIQKGFTRALINNPTQVPKQLTALGYTFWEAPEPLFKAVGLLTQAMMEGKNSPLSKAINGLFETTTLGQRLYHPEIIEVKEKYTIDKPEVLRYVQQFLKGFNAVIGGNLLVPTDAVVSQVATLAGYIQQAERSGKPFNIFKEAEEGYDMMASAAADQMQAKTNNENAAIYFSRRQLNNRALYYLGNFQANAVRNLYISIRKIVSGRTKQEVKEGLQGVAGYIFSASLFVGAGMLSSYLVTASAFSLYQEIMNALGDDEDDEKEKQRTLKYLDSRQLLNLKRKLAGEAISVATGIYGTMARAALEATLAGLEQAYYKSTPDEEKPADRIFFTPEATGYAGVVADNIISPLEMTAKASDPQMEAMAQTGLLGAKILGQSAMGFYTQNLLNAKKLAEKEAKARKEEQAEALQQKAFPKKKKLSEAKKQWTQSIEQGDVTKAKEAFNSIVKLSDDTPYITAIELRESFYKDKVKPSIISKEDEYIWFGYLFNNKFGDKIIGSEKLKNLVPPSEKEKYIEEYKKELAKIHKMTSVMNKTIKVKNVRGKIVDWSAPFDWVKQVKDKVGNK